MDNDYNPNQPQPDQEADKLELQLREAIAAENFFETASGKLTTQILTQEITKLTKRILSTEFLKDHVGYVNCLCELNANRNLLKRLQVGGSPVRKAKILEKLHPEDE